MMKSMIRSMMEIQVHNGAAAFFPLYGHSACECNVSDYLPEKFDRVVSYYYDILPSIGIYHGSLSGFTAIHLEKPHGIRL